MCGYTAVPEDGPTCMFVRMYLMAEIFSGNLKHILNLFYALSRFKHHVNAAAESHTPVTSSTNDNHMMKSSQAAFSGGSRDQQFNQMNHVKAR